MELVSFKIGVLSPQGMVVYGSFTIIYKLDLISGKSKKLFNS